VRQHTHLECHAVFQVYRCYRSDASLLTDLVRCQIVFGELCDIDSFMKVCCQEGMQHSATNIFTLRLTRSPGTPKVWQMRVSRCSQSKCALVWSCCSCHDEPQMAKWVQLLFSCRHNRSEIALTGTIKLKHNREGNREKILRCAFCDSSFYAYTLPLTFTFTHLFAISKRTPPLRFSVHRWHFLSFEVSGTVASNCACTSR